MNKVKRIRIRWYGPLDQDAVRDSTLPTDYGLYLVYGDHRIYGSNVLLYVGKAEQQTFGARIPQHKEWFDWKDVNLRFYLGRILGEEDPKDTTKDWDDQIQCAEIALIQYCQPAWNSASLNSDNSTEIFGSYSIGNFGSKQDLPSMLNKNANISESELRPDGLKELSNIHFR